MSAKIASEDLESILSGLVIPNDGNVLIGMASSDDAGVYKISDELALIQTVDFFTPIVDDPYDFSQILANQGQNYLEAGSHYCFSISSSNPLPGAGGGCSSGSRGAGGCGC